MKIRSLADSFRVDRSEAAVGSVNRFDIRGLFHKLGTILFGTQLSWFRSNVVVSLW